MKKLRQLTKALLLFATLSLLLLTMISCDFLSNLMGETSQEPTSTTPPTEACTHETTEWVVDESASCSTTGSKHKECVACKEILETAVIATTAHTEVVVDGEAATCEKAGLTAGKECSVCHTAIVQQKPIDALGHNESDWIIDKQAEVGVMGSKHTECTRCSTLIQTATIPALIEECKHAEKEWVIAIPPTCQQTGVRHEVCSNCGAKISEDVLGTVDHTIETVLGTAATCTEAGRTDGKRCSICTVVTVTQIVIPPLGHSFDLGTCKNCGIGEPYGIWIADGQGNPMSNIIVKIMQNGEQIKMYPYQGEFLSMNLESGTYEVVLDLSQLGETYTYDESLCVLTPQKRSTSIRLFQTVVEETSVYVGYPINADYPAYYVKEGATQVTLTPNDYTFFIFTPITPAIYTITYEGNSNLTISYHGGSFFTQGYDLSVDSTQVTKYENGLSCNIYASNIGPGSDYVFAIKSTSETSCILQIKNAGDPGTRIEDAPWTPYLEDADMVDKQLNTTVSGTYTTIDLTDLSVKAVYNETDGYYHIGTEDGPIIFIDLTTDSQFVSSIQTICLNQRMGEYVYDVNGKLVEKRSYNELFEQYGTFDENLEEAVRVPLTKKLAEAVQSFGNKNGWWDPMSDSNIFVSVLLGSPYNQEYAWLLYCGYYA